jgi:hypothetical protein
LGLTLWDVSKALDTNITDLSNVERQRIKRPDLERKLLAYYKRQQPRARRTATA